MIQFNNLVSDTPSKDMAFFDEKKGFSLLQSPEGKTLFNAFVLKNFTEEKESFAYSLGYYLITGRNGAWIYGDETFVFIACRHPNIENEFLFFTPLYDKERVTALSQSLGLEEIKISRVSSEISVSQTFEQPCEETVMDWIYPSHTLSTQSVSSLEGPGYRRARRSLRDFQNKSIKVMSSCAQTKSLFPLLQRQAQFLAKNQTLSSGEILNSLIEGLQVYEKNKDCMNILVFYQDDVPFGFVLWDKTLSDHANLLWLAQDIGIPNIGYCVYHNLCIFLKDQNISYLNTGGSETAGLNEFKSMFNPVRSFGFSNRLIDIAQENKIAA